MDDKEYIESRVNDQIEYYDNQSVKGRNWYKGLTMVQIVCGALVPFLSGFSANIPYSEWIIGLLGVFVAISTGMLALNKYQERWINFRTTCETLRHLKYLYLTGSTPYNSENSLNNFVNDVEAIISKENSDWGAYTKKIVGGDSDDPGPSKR